MLWIIAAVLLAFWIVGLALKLLAGAIHIALVLAVILFVWGWIQHARRPAVASR